MTRFALGLVIFGAINWLLVAWLGFDLISEVTGPYLFWRNALYTIIGIAGLYCIGLLFDHRYCSNYPRKRDHD